MVLIVGENFEFCPKFWINFSVTTQLTTLLFVAVIARRQNMTGFYHAFVANPPLILLFKAPAQAQFYSDMISYHVIIHLLEFFSDITGFSLGF